MMKEVPLIFEKSVFGRQGVRTIAVQDGAQTVRAMLPATFLRKQPPVIPEVGEVDVVRHFTALSKRNYGLDDGFYPLGSCTMKHNPKINEMMARLPGFMELHPEQPDESVQGALQLMFELQEMLAEITGMDAFSLLPAAGAHGEQTGLLMLKAYHESRGESQRNCVIVPDSAHGTNPASAAVTGFEVIQVSSAGDGTVDIEQLKQVVNGPLSHRIAGLMLTNPNTLGLFETRIHDIAQIVHHAGGLLYYDGANLNAVMGITRPGDMGFDIIHLNLHKTFSTPHGGGGPGAGPVGVKSGLVKFLPTPIISRIQSSEKETGFYRRVSAGPDSIGRVREFYGNFGVLVRAYCYILTMGGDGLTQAAKIAVLNANYLRCRLNGLFNVPFDRTCMHEFVLAGIKTKDKAAIRQGITLDIAKRMLDFGIHPPTIYFPLIVPEAMMIEPTETESPEMLDDFVEILRQIRQESLDEPGNLHHAPFHTPVRRIDEVRAARSPVLRWIPDDLEEL